MQSRKNNFWICKSTKYIIIWIVNCISESDNSIAAAALAGCTAWNLASVCFLSSRFARTTTAQRSNSPKNRFSAPSQCTPCTEIRWQDTSDSPTTDSPLIAHNVELTSKPKVERACCWRRQEWQLRHRTTETFNYYFRFLRPAAPLSNSAKTRTEDTKLQFN